MRGPWCQSAHTHICVQCAVACVSTSQVCPVQRARRKRFTSTMHGVQHLPRSKRIFGYLAYLPEGAIRFCTHKPDYSSIQEQEFDWTRFVYGNVKEHIPHTSQNNWGSLWSPPTMLRQISIMIWSLEDLSQPS